ncbi:MAG: dTDP-4-dehydrorhamnose 3,5-epimerase [Flavobacteriales bacterium]|mgnify:CR=1 FL=1|jgi:dTDP-4-dehydrorhamnose 3,5-epimerase
MMQKELTPLDGLILLRPRIFTDDRGHFFESFNSRAFKELSGITADFVQDNESMSIKDVLRGLHFQEEPFAQGKLVRVVQGAVVDVCVDIRPSSPTYGQHFKVRLDATEKAMLWIPPGFAHGFVALEEGSAFAYKCTAYYHPAAERTLLWNDADLGIDWGIADPIISAKDKEGMAFKALRTQAQR